VQHPSAGVRSELHANAVNPGEPAPVKLLIRGDEAIASPASPLLMAHHRPCRRAWPVGAGNCVTLCDLGILLDQATEPVPTQNPDVRA